VVKYLKFYRDDARGQRIARVWAKKSGRLTPALKAEFAKAGLPTDLVWLSLIESGHNPTIFSPAGAAGLWQFIPESGRMYGLTVDRWVDERLDPQRATDAAIQYLKDLRARFGTWELAMAGYNMGHGGLLRAVRKFNTNDFWTLARYEAGIPWETTLYVPKIFAIAVVMTNKKSFGIDDVQPESPISFDTVYVEPGVPLAEVARAARAPESEILGLNAHYLSGRIPPAAGSEDKRWPVRVPPGVGATATRALAKSTPTRLDGFEPYVVRFGDSLDAIAVDRGCDEAVIRRANQIAGSERLATGTVLFVPNASDAARPSAADDVVVVPARRFSYTERRRIFYRVLGGDTLDQVARQLGVAASELSTWNALDGSARLQHGMVLQAYAATSFDLSKVRYYEPSQVRVLIAGSDEFFEHFEGLNDRKRIVVTARDGDTLSTVGKRYGMSTGMMERINRFSRNKKLTAGDRVVVYTKRAMAQDGSVVELPRELPPVQAPRPEALPALPRQDSRVPENGRRAVLP
jgi:membrane-bound lytic murein transglycosylase D